MDLRWQLIASLLRGGSQSINLGQWFLTRFNKIAIQGTPQMAVDKEAISLSRVYSYDSKCTCPYSMCSPP